MAHNKTLAAQLYGEFREFFPDNAVEYFVSYYDYYQPEAYVPSSDTFIEKDASVNEHIEQMRLSATKALLERPRLDHRRDRVLDLRPRRPAGLPEHGAAPRPRRAARPAQAAAPPRRHAVHAQRARPVAGHLPRARRRHRHLPGRVRARGRARRAVRRRDRGAVVVRPADRRGAAQGAAPHRLPVLALRDAQGAHRPRDRADPRGAARAARGAALAREAARGAAARAAHDVRPRDDDGGRLLRRHRELLALPVRTRGRRAAAVPVRLPAEGRAARRGREPRDRAADRRHVQGRPLAQGDAGRVRFPAAVRARQPAAAVRRVGVSWRRR